MEEFMNPKKMVKLSNMIGFISVLALIYWIIIFITMEVFDLRVFKEHTTSTFNFSIMGILALMFGALIVNVMFNLSRIADSRITERDKEEEQPPKKSKKQLIIFLASFPAIICLLFLGDFISSKKMETNLKKSADEMVKTYSNEIKEFSNYSFTKEWINHTANSLQIIERIDQNFNNVYLILQDVINGNNMYLTFSNHAVNMDEKTVINKIDYLKGSALKEREYLDKVFKGNYNEKYFVSDGGTYYLFVPLRENGNTIVLMFSNRQRYGTFSS
jgi:hypothetical protein